MPCTTVVVAGICPVESLQLGVLLYWVVAINKKVMRCQYFSGYHSSIATC
jgi:hypothetical protein